jgi:hypothetical protein
MRVFGMIGIMGKKAGADSLLSHRHLYLQIPTATCRQSYLVGDVLMMSSFTTNNHVKGILIYVVGVMPRC